MNTSGLQPTTPLDDLLNWLAVHREIVWEAIFQFWLKSMPLHPEVATSLTKVTIGVAIIVVPFLVFFAFVFVMLGVVKILNLPGEALLWFREGRYRYPNQWPPVLIAIVLFTAFLMVRVLFS